MLRPTAAKAAATAATALVLLTACGGSSGASDSGDTPTSTPSAPAVASFDPPKAFVASSAFGVQPTKKDTQSTFQAGMVGQTTLIAGVEGVSGRNIAARGQAWFYPSTELDTIETLDLTRPMAVQVDGKDVVAIAYLQSDKDSGTHKAKSQVVFHWIDASSGTLVAEVTAKLPQFADEVVSQAYDPATGQLAVGVSTYDGPRNAETTTVYADPKTQKPTAFPGMTAASVLSGVVVGSKGGNDHTDHDGTIVLADGATGKVTKQIATKRDFLYPAGSGAKRAYFSARTYPEQGSTNRSYDTTLYSVDIATGDVVQTKSAVTRESLAIDYNCLGDRADAVVCVAMDRNFEVEIVGLDDTSGKKVWGWTSTSQDLVVPKITAAFHGIVYAQGEQMPVLIDAATGDDVKAAAGSTPTIAASAATANGSDLSLYNNEPESPVAVTQYGGTYLQDTLGTGFYTILIALTPTA